MAVCEYLKHYIQKARFTFQFDSGIVDFDFDCQMW